MNTERFWAKVDRSGGADDCWPWTGRVRGARRGHRWQGEYGEIRVSGRSMAAHRYAYTLAYGPIPDGALVLHSCDNPRCCNPAHLTLGTHARNMWERESRGRTARGERLPQAKLTAAAVADIRRRYAAGETQKTLAAVYDVNRTTIGQVVRRVIWRHVPD